MRPSIWEELGRPRFWILLSAALLCFFVSILWEQAMHDATSVDQAFLSSKTWIHFVREIGFACFIALVVGVFIERSARHEQAMEAVRRDDRLAESVFRGVFANDLPRALVDLAVDRILKAKIIRLSHKNTYTLMPGECTLQNGESLKYIEFKVSSAYEVKNVSNETTRFDIQLSFPRPADARLAQKAKLSSLIVNGKPMTQVELDAGDMAVDDSEFDMRFRWERTLGPSEIIDVRSEYTMIKERSDSELWVSVLPSIKMELSLNVHVPDLEFGVRPVHAGRLRKVSGQGDQGHHAWEVDGACMSHQGMHVWWRPKSPVPEKVG
jgi:hypothetical protein